MECLLSDLGREGGTSQRKGMRKHLKVKHSVSLSFENQTFPPGSDPAPPAGSCSEPLLPAPRDSYLASVPGPERNRHRSPAIHRAIAQRRAWSPGSGKELGERPEASGDEKERKGDWDESREREGESGRGGRMTEEREKQGKETKKDN